MAEPFDDWHRNDHDFAPIATECPAQMKISTILDHIDSGHMALPEFQRGYVWNRDQRSSSNLSN